MNFFDSTENKIFEKIKLKATEDLKIWNLANLFFPLSTIAVSILFFSFSSKVPSLCGDGIVGYITKYLDFILTGAIPLIGINLLVTCSFFLIRFDKNKEQKLGIKTNYLRLKLIIFSLLSYLFLSALFAIQNIYSPFNNIFKDLFLLILSFLGVKFSLSISNRLFLLQEELIDKSYEETVTEEVKNLKKAIE